MLNKEISMGAKSIEINSMTLFENSMGTTKNKRRQDIFLNRWELSNRVYFQGNSVTYLQKSSVSLLFQSNISFMNGRKKMFDVDF